MSDYIKREDAIGVVLGITPTRGFVPVDAVTFNLQKLHAADVQEVKHGKWGKQILVEDGFGGHRVGYICPVCKEFIPNKGKYCLECGAKMDLKESEE